MKPITKVRRAESRRWEGNCQHEKCRWYYSSWEHERAFAWAYCHALWHLIWEGKLSRAEGSGRLRRAREALRELERAAPS